MKFKKDEKIYLNSEAEVIHAVVEFKGLFPLKRWQRVVNKIYPIFRKSPPIEGLRAEDLLIMDQDGKKTEIKSCTTQKKGMYVIEVQGLTSGTITLL